MSPNVRRVSLEVFPVTPMPNRGPERRGARSDRTSALRRSDPSRRRVLMSRPLRARSLFMRLPCRGMAIQRRSCWRRSRQKSHVLTVEFISFSTVRLQAVRSSMITLDIYV